MLAAVPKKEDVEALEEALLEGTDEPTDSGIENASDSGSEEHEAASVDILEDAVGWNVSKNFELIS